MHRCGICNYTEQDGSDLLDKAPSPNNKVRWNEKHQGFLCTDCSKSVQNTIKDWEFMEG